MIIKSNWITNAKVNETEYLTKYDYSIENNEIFWREEGKRIDWINEYSKIKDITYSKNIVDIKWYYDGSLNVSYNCIDRHAKKNPDRTAIIWEGQ